ncbi:MAG: hypothetical protein M3015_05325 [Bacteroidota bacterium]|nr:hypothetical protein [Bacteroidota bacterium]
MEFIEAINNYREEPITIQALKDLLKGYKRPLDKANELLKKGVLTQIKKGLYIPGPKLNIPKPEPFLLANHLLGPSYISLESALSYWGMIPEKVYEITSVTVKRSKKFKTHGGRFTYIHIPLPYYSFGIQRIELTPRQTILIASKEKALCDKILTTSGVLIRSPKQAKEVLIEDFRIEKQTLSHLNINEIKKWLSDAPQKNSLRNLIKMLTDI